MLKIHFLFILHLCAFLKILPLSYKLRLWIWLTDVSVAMQNINHIFKSVKCIESHQNEVQKCGSRKGCRSDFRILGRWSTNYIGRVETSFWTRGMAKKSWIIKKVWAPVSSRVDWPTIFCFHPQSLIRVFTTYKNETDGSVSPSVNQLLYFQSWNLIAWFSGIIS